MKCEHSKMPEQPRPRTIVTFRDSEVAEALHDYACKTGELMPTGEMCVWGIDHGRGPDSQIKLCIERGEGQEIWPPEDVGDGG